MIKQWMQKWLDKGLASAGMGTCLPPLSGTPGFTARYPTGRCPPTCAAAHRATSCVYEQA
jgi:hypothetical protein